MGTATDRAIFIAIYKHTDREIVVISIGKATEGAIVIEIGKATDVAINMLILRHKRDLGLVIWINLQ